MQSGCENGLGSGGQERVWEDLQEGAWEARSACDAVTWSAGSLGPSPGPEAASHCAARPGGSQSLVTSLFGAWKAGVRGVTPLPFREGGPVRSAWPFPDGVRGEDRAWEQWRGDPRGEMGRK